MPKKIIFLAGIAVIIFVLSLVLSAAAILIKDRDIRESLNKSSALYEKLPSADSGERKRMLDEFENQSLGLASRAQNKEAQAAGLYNAGTVRLEEFLRSAEYSDLGKAIDFLQQSVILAPKDSEVAKRAATNLSIARNLLAKMKSPDKNAGDQDGEAGGQDSQKGADGSESAEVSKKNSAGVTETGEILEKGEGYGRGAREEDY